MVTILVQIDQIVSNIANEPKKVANVQCIVYQGQGGGARLFHRTASLLLKPNWLSEAL